MRVFLGNAPWQKRGLYGVRAGSRWPHFEDQGQSYMPFPFFLAYATALLERDGHECLLVDGIALGIGDEEFLARAESFDPALIVLEVSTPSLPDDLKLVARARRRFPRARLALAGLHEQMYHPGFLDAHPEVDFTLIGEYEVSLAALAAALEKGGDARELPGLVWRHEGKTGSAGRRAELRDLDALPWPARHHLPMERYHDEPGEIPMPSVQMWASRGCPYTCSFCAWPQIVYGSNRYRVRAVKDVVDEMAHVVERHGARSIYFDDDTFNIGKPRMREFCDELLSRDWRVPWAIMARADTIDEGTMRLMRRAGLAAVKYGVESADQRIVDDMGKRLDLDAVRRFCALARELDVRTHLTFVFGMPGESADSMQKTLDLALELDPHTLQFSIATPFPGSRLYREMVEQGRLMTTDFSKFDGFHHAVIRTDALKAEEITAFVRYATRVWRQHMQRRTVKPVCFLPPSTHASVIVPTWNSAAHLSDCLDALRAQSVRDFEIIVVDGHSRDGSADLVAERYPEARLIRLSENRGFAGNVNAGITASKGAFVALLNADARPEPHWLATLFEAMDTHPEWGFLASLVRQAAHPDLIDSAGDGLTRGGYAFQVGHGRREGPEPLAAREVFGASGCASMYRRELLQDVGDFDERFFAYLEDVDYSFRARHRGWRCGFVPGAVVHHLGHASYGAQYTEETAYLLGRNRVWVLVKAMPKRLLLRYLPRVLWRSLFEQARHGLRTGFGRPYFRGLRDGFLAFKELLPERRRILGGRRSTDGEVRAWLLHSERDHAAWS